MPFPIRRSVLHRRLHRTLPVALLLVLGTPAFAQTLEELQVGPFACAQTLRDELTGGCLAASTKAGIGYLVPQSLDLHVDALTGYVGMGNMEPDGRLHIEDSTPYGYGALIDHHGPAGIGLRIDMTDTSGVGSLGLSVRARDSTGVGIVAAAGGTLLSVQGSGVTALSTASSGPQTAGVVGVTVPGARDDAGVMGVTYSWTDGAGVEGIHQDPAGTGAGVHGATFSTDSSAVGTLGVVESSAPGSYSAGVHGLNRGTGPFGIGVHGYQAGSGWGVFGDAAGLGVGVRGRSAAGGYAVYAEGDMAASGVKSFVQPHPLDAAKEIRFVCLEGNESGTYFRGSARLVQGRAVIEVPEDFRWVSESDSLTVQLTPLGPVLLWVESKDTERIVVRGAQDVEFDYFVNGVRRGFADFDTVRANRSFVPRERGVPFGGELPDGLRSILRQNGTLRADGTPNEHTAQRLGWDLAEPSPERRTSRAPHMRALPTRP